MRWGSRVMRVLWEFTWFLCDQGLLSILPCKQGTWSCLQPPCAILKVTKEVLCNDQRVPTTISVSRVSVFLRIKHRFPYSDYHHVLQWRQLSHTEPFTVQVPFWSSGVTLVKVHSSRGGVVCCLQVDVTVVFWPCSCSQWRRLSCVGLFNFWFSLKLEYQSVVLLDPCVAG